MEKRHGKNHADGDRNGLDVCLICHPYSPLINSGRGHDRYIFELARNLRELGDGNRIQLLDLGYSHGVTAAALRQIRLIPALLSAKADLYHAMSPIGGAPAVMTGRFPLVTTVHDLLPFQVAGYDHAWKHRYLRACIRSSVRRSDALIVGNRFMKRELSERFDVDPSRIHIVGYGVDLEHFRLQPDVPRKEGRILYLGEVSRSKGVDSLLRAFSLAGNRLAGTELLIGGKECGDRAALEALARDSGSVDIRFLGFVPEKELPALYASASVMVFPSRYGFGLTPLEAMACGTPVIAGDVLDAPEFIGDAGLLADPDDFAALADAIVRVLTEPGLKERLAARGIERAKENAWRRIASETASVYRAVLAQNIRS